MLLKNPDFQNGLGMDIHIRTKQLKQFFYVSSSVLRIGDDTLEVMGDLKKNLYWINQKATENVDNGIVGFISGYSIHSKQINSKQYEFIVDIGNKLLVIMKTFKNFVRVNIKSGKEENFRASLGLLGSNGSGKIIA